MPGDLDLTELLGLDPAFLGGEAGFGKENNIRQDSFDQAIFEELVETSSELRYVVEEKGQPWPRLVSDVWATFFKGAPELVGEAEVKEQFLANRPFVERLLSDPQTEQVRAFTVLDEAGAAMAAIAACRKLKEEVEKRENLREAFALATSQPRKGSEKAAGGAEAKEALEAAAQDLRQAVREALKEGLADAEDTDRIVRGWGLEPGELRRVPPGKRIELLEALKRSWRARRLVALVGRLRNTADARRKERLKRERDEIHSITLGSYLPRVLPSELAALADPKRKLDFFRKLAEGGLLQYDLLAREKAARGPMVCLVDCSGSMSGTKMDWAIAVAFALANAVRKQKRSAVLIFFAERVKEIAEFRKERVDLEKVVSILSIGANGGTDFVLPLTEALLKIRSKGFEKADVVMITDGECLIPEEFLDRLRAEKDALKFRVWAILIGRRDPGQLREWSDHVWVLSSLDQDADGVAAELFEEVC